MKSIITTFKSIKGNNSLLSSSLHKQVDVANENLVPLESLLRRKLSREDLGKEIGSINYVDVSNMFFMKTKALQSYSFLPVLNSESTESIVPQAFINHNLKAGDVILSKDSNIGETIILVVVSIFASVLTNLFFSGENDTLNLSPLFSSQIGVFTQILLLETFFI